MAKLNPNSNPLLLWNKIKELKYKLRQFETLLGVCPFNPEDIKGDKGDPGDDANVTAENIKLALGFEPQEKLDVSKFVPYTEADKDINIGAHYFETSQGFKKTDGTATQALTADGGTFDLTTKLDKGTYTGTAQDLKNDIENLEGENVAQYDLINDLNSELDSERARNDAQDSILNNLEGINYVWSPTNRTLTLFDREGNQMSQVSLVSLDNEGTDIRYNATTLSLELYNADNELLDSIPVSSFIGSVGTQLQLNSNELQLKDSQGNILSTVSFSIVNILGLQTALDSRLNKGSYPGNASDLKNEIDGKLNKPTITSNTTSYPFVVGEDGNGNSARLPAGDLGKNFFNSDLSNTTARNHTMNARVTVNTLGNPHTLSGLPNKNADITNFRKVRVQNASGLDAVVDSKSMLLDMPSYLTEQERTNWKTAMNGGWTTNTMSVALISPFIIKNDNNVNWILLKGANLNLPPTSFEVAIMNEEGTSVLAIVPNSQVQLYTNGTDLIFYYNFFTLGLGKYKIRLWNGVAYYITNSKLTVTDTITNIPFQQGEIRLVSGSSSINVATAYEVILKPDPNIKAQPTEPLNVLSDIVSNWVDGNVLQGNEDWLVQLSVECIVKNWWWNRIDIANVGLSSSSSSSLLSPTVGGILIYNYSSGDTPLNPDIGIIGGDALIKLANNSQINYIKIGSILQTLIVASNGNIVSSITTIDTSQNYRLVANCNNQPTNTQLNYHAGIKLTKVRISNL